MCKMWLVWVIWWLWCLHALLTFLLCLIMKEGLGNSYLKFSTLNGWLCGVKYFEIFPRIFYARWMTNKTNKRIFTIDTYMHSGVQLLSKLSRLDVIMKGMILLFKRLWCWWCIDCACGITILVRNFMQAQMF